MRSRTAWAVAGLCLLAGLVVARPLPRELAQRAPDWGPPARRRVRPRSVPERHAPALLPTVARPRRASWSHTTLHGSLPVSGQRPPLEPHPDVPAPGVALHPPVGVRPPRGLQPARPALLPGGRARRVRVRSPAHGRSRRRARRGRRLQPAPRTARALVRGPSSGLRARPRAGRALGTRRRVHARTGGRRCRRGARGRRARHAGAPVHLPHRRPRRRPRRLTRVVRTDGEVGVGAARRFRPAPRGGCGLGLHAPRGVRRRFDRRHRAEDRGGAPVLPRTGRCWRNPRRTAGPGSPPSRSLVSSPAGTPEMEVSGCSTGRSSPRASC